MTDRQSLKYSADRFQFTKKQQFALLLGNYIQLIHVVSVSSLLFIPWAPSVLRWLAALFTLYVLPPLTARLIILIRPIRKECITIPSRDYFVWWFLLNLQMVFCRFSFLEELLRVFPCAYSTWLRLWGSDIGKHTYWAAGLRILDRSFLHIGDQVAFGAGVRLNAHVIIENDEGVPELLLAKIRIGDRALIGGYSLLTAGTHIAENESTRALLTSPPFSHWQGGKRVKKGKQP